MKEDKKRREKKDENKRRPKDKTKERRKRRGRTTLYILYSKGVRTEGIIGTKKEFLHFVRRSVNETFV